MFKKNIKTGEIVNITEWEGNGDKRRKTDWVSFIDSKGEEHPMVKGMNFYWDFDDLEYEDKYAEREHQRNVEGHFCVFAGMAMQGLLHTQPLADADYIVGRSVELAIKLTEELANWFVDTKKFKVLRKEK